MLLPLLEKEHNIITFIAVCVHTKYYTIQCVQLKSGPLTKP